MDAYGEEPQIIYYLEYPPTREVLVKLIRNSGLTVREAIRTKGTPYKLGLDNPTLSDDALLDAMLVHPILINRPFVITAKGERLCRPSEVVLDILTRPQLRGFTKEDGEMVIDAKGQRIVKLCCCN